jgi:two-component system cell cycle sensor histidine kinase/response regulator CckA
MNVLIVDDIAANRRLLRAILEADGIAVREGADGKEALAVLEKTEVDAIISDVLMPNMDGYRLCYEVRHSPRWSSIPFIIYTSTYTSPSDEKTGVEMGADRFLRKPMDPKSILAALKDVMLTARPRRPPSTNLDLELHLVKEYSERLVAKLEQKNIELAENFAVLRELEARKSAILQSSLDAIVTTDQQGRIIEFNPAAEKMFGFSLESILGQALADFLPEYRELQPEGAAGRSMAAEPGRGVSPSVSAAYRHGFVLPGEGDVVAKLSEMTALRADGAEFPVEFSMVRIPGEGATLYTCFIRDITERKQAQEQRRLQATALETTANAILITDRKGMILWVNDAFTKLTGYACDEVLGKTPRVLKSGIHDRAFYRNIWEAILAGKTWRGEFTNRRKDGTLFHDEHTITPVRSLTGQITHFVGVLHDVTERKHAEDELLLAHEKLRHLLAHTPAVIYALRVEEQSVKPHIVSENINEFLGFTVSETLHYEWWVSQLHPEDRQRALESISETLSQSASRTEYRLGHKDGSYRFVEDNRRLIRDASGLPKEIVGVWTDITERKKLEREVMIREQRLNSFFSGATAGLALIGPDLRFLQVNDTLAEMNGLSAAEHLGRTIQEVLPELAPAALPEIQKVIETGEPVLNGELSGETPREPHVQRHWIRSVFPIIGQDAKVEGAGLIVVEVTDRKRAEESLRLVSERLLLATRSSNVGIWDLDLINNTLLWDEAMFRIYGITPNEFVGAYDSWRKAVHPEDLPRVEEEIQRAMRGEKSFDTEFRLLWPDQSVRHIKADAIIERSASGQPVRFVGTNWDITERKRAQGALEASEERFRQLAENVNDVFWVSDKNLTQILYVSPAYERIWGRSCQSLYERPMSFAEAVHSKDRARLSAVLERQTKGENTETEYRIIRPDGIERWIRDCSFPIRTETGEHYRTGGVVTDITERKQRDLRLHIQHEITLALAEARSLQETTRKVLEIIGEGLAWDIGELWTVDSLAKQLRCVEIWHPQSTEFQEFVSATRLMTFARDSGLPGQIWASGKQLWISDVTQENACSRRSFAAKLGLRGFIGFPIQVRQEVHGVLGFFSAEIREPTGELLDMFGAISSQLGQFVERRLLEDQLRQSQKMEAIGQLAGGVAHDFNNLLTVIQGHAELLMSQDGLDGRTLEQLNQMFLAGQRAANLTRQLLTFSRKQVMQVKILDLNQVIGDLLKMLRRVIGEDVALQTNLARKLPSLRADAGMLEQVVMNLCVNARDAMPQGGRLAIGTETAVLGERDVQQMPQARSGEFVCLRVRDTGSGMSPEILAHIFEPFFTTKAAGKGTGLGLATVYGIVKQHEGWIEVSSNVGEGTEFKIFLPGAPSPASETARIAPQLAMRGGTETILLVEDELAVRELARTVLERLGYQVLEAGSGVDAVSVWEEHRSEIDLLLTDMIMPDQMTGLELAQRLQPEKPDLKVIFTSGYSTDLVGRQLELIEGKNFLQKPYPPRKLAQTIRECLDAKTQV